MESWCENIDVTLIFLFWVYTKSHCMNLIMLYISEM
jgi:hypothetical protein